MRSARRSPGARARRQPKTRGHEAAERSLDPASTDAVTQATLDAAVRAALAEAGLLGSPPDDSDLPTDPAEIAALEREHEAWLATLTEPIGLAEAVIEDRR
jgi:hypothetical protein